MSKKRRAKVIRTTTETDISCTLVLDGRGKTSIDTGIGFFDHMLTALARHALLDLTLTCQGDRHIDDHHTVEDVGLVLGQALDKALGDRKGITRFGASLLPMDESLSRVAIDLGGRPFLVYQLANRRRKINDFDLTLLQEFWRAFVTQGRLNLHIEHLYGKDPHHAHESTFKATARALYQALAFDPRVLGSPSTKGQL